MIGYALYSKKYKTYCPEGGKVGYWKPKDTAKNVVPRIFSDPKNAIRGFKMVSDQFYPAFKAADVVLVEISISRGAETPIDFDNL